MSELVRSVIIPNKLILLTPDTGAGGPRGFMFLDFLLQEDADRCLQELTKRPLFLFGRRLRVNYAPPLLRPNRPSRQLDDARRNPTTVFLCYLPDQLHMNSWALLDAVSFFGEIVDLRIGEPLNSLCYQFQWLIWHVSTSRFRSGASGIGLRGLFACQRLPEDDRGNQCRQSQLPGTRSSSRLWLKGYCSVG
jgi:RNA recognition motif-containing protein